MSEWRDISTAPRDGVFVLLHNDRWSTDVEGFLAQGQSVLVCQHAHPEHRKPRNQSGAADALETTDGRRREILKPRPLGASSRACRFDNVRDRVSPENGLY